MTTLWFTASPTPLRPPPAVNPLQGRDHRRDEPEDDGLDLAGPQVRQLGQGGERGDVGARGPALDDDVEEVAAGHTHHGDQSV